MDIYEWKLKNGIARTKEFEKKALLNLPSILASSADTHAHTARQVQCSEFTTHLKN